MAIAQPVSSRGKVSAEILCKTVATLCQDKYLGLRVLAHALGRDSDDLRKRTLTPMVKNGRLRAAHPSPSDPRQAYTTDNTKGEA